MWKTDNTIQETVTWSYWCWRCWTRGCASSFTHCLLALFNKQCLCRVFVHLRLYLPHFKTWCRPNSFFLFCSDSWNLELKEGDFVDFGDLLTFNVWDSEVVGMPALPFVAPQSTVVSNGRAARFGGGIFLTLTTDHCSESTEVCPWSFVSELSCRSSLSPAECDPSLPRRTNTI